VRWPALRTGRDPHGGSSVSHARAAAALPMAATVTMTPITLPVAWRRRDQARPHLLLPTTRRLAAMKITS
jgi:hypothetical protein